MKKLIFTLLFCAFAPFAHAEDPYVTEIRALGSVAGQGMACKAAKYETYELLARAILITKAFNNQEQAMGMRLYNEEKANSYVSKQMDGFSGCKEIARRFDSQSIFKMRLYADGTIEMPDGKIFTPRQPYDVTLIKTDSGKESARAKTIYDRTKGKRYKTTIKDDRMGSSVP